MGHEAVQRASAEISRLLVETYQGENGPHLETLIGAAGALTGEFALRAAEPVLPETGWIASERAGRLIFGEDGEDEESLWAMIVQGATVCGAAAADLPDKQEVVRRTAAAAGSRPYPPISVPRHHYPREWSPNACPRLRGSIEKIAAEHGLDAEETAVSLSFATALLIALSKNLLAPEIAATLALEIMWGVSKMPPIRQELH